MIRTLITCAVLTASISSAAMADQWCGDIDLNSGYNDNVYFQANELEIINSGVEQNSDAQNQLILSTSYKFLNTRNSDMKWVLDYFYEGYANNELETSITTMTLPFSYYTNNNRFRISPLVSRYVIDRDAALLSSGVNLEVTHKMGRFNLGTSYQHLDKAALSSSYDKYEGDGKDISVYYSGRWLSRYFKVSVGAYENNYSETVDGDDSHDGVYASLSYGMRYKKLDLSLYGKVKSKAYVSDPYTQFEREDSQTTVSISPAYALSRSTSVYASIQWTNNSSNQNNETDNMNYTQTISSIGFRYSF